MSQHNDTDFMSELEAATHLKPATPAMLMFIAIIGLVSFLIAWAAIAQVEQLTRGEGRVVPSQDIQVVQSLEGGILAELLIQEGEQVEKGQILLRISDVQFSAEERGTEARSRSLRAKRARLQAEAEGKPLKLPADIKAQAPAIAANEEALYKSRQEELRNAHAILEEQIQKASAQMSEANAQITRLQNNRTLLQKELDITRDLVAKRAMPKLEEIRLSRELSDINGQINALAQQKKALRAEVAVAKKEKAAQNDRFRSQALGELHDVHTQIAGLEENLKSIGDRVYRTELRAPVSGVVNRIGLKTIGGVIEPAMKMVEIVPLDDELKIMAKVQATDVAFLHPGQSAKIKITAYDPQKYGALDGELVRIGANSISERDGSVFFEVELRTDKNHMGPAEAPLPITPGMVANIEIITGKRTILEYMLKPILRARARALTER